VLFFRCRHLIKEPHINRIRISIENQKANETLLAELEEIKLSISGVPKFNARIPKSRPRPKPQLKLSIPPKEKSASYSDRTEHPIRSD